MRVKKIDLDNFPTSQSAQDMLATVTPGFYANSYVGKWLYQVMGLEMDEARQLIADELPLQMFPETATWGLMYHELKWGLPVRDYLPYEKRRSLIYERRDKRAPMTPYRMENMLQSVTGFEASICDIHDGGKWGYKVTHPNSFIAVFVGDGSLNTKDVKQLLDSAKQSHTTYIIIDRIDTALDNTALEQMILRNINIILRIPFWRAALLDGEHLLDGSILLDAMRDYDLILGLMYRQGEFYTPHSVDLKSLRLFLVQKPNEQYTGLRMQYADTVHFWTALKLDGSVLLNGTELLDKSRQEFPTSVSVGMNTKLISEKIGDVTVITRKDLAYLDGSLSLSGTRLLDSEYHKEVI